MSTPTNSASAPSARKRARIVDPSDDSLHAKRFSGSAFRPSSRSLAAPSAGTPSPSASDVALVSGGSGRRKSSSSSCMTCPVLRSELDALRAEIDHASSIRILERRRSDQAEARLKRQIQFVTEEAEEARRLMDEMRERTEEDVARMAAARREALERVRDAEGRLRRTGDGKGSPDGGGNGVAVSAEKDRRKNRLLEERLEATKAEANGLKEALEAAEARAAEAEKRAARAERELEMARADDEQAEEDDSDTKIKMEEEEGGGGGEGKEGDKVAVQAEDLNQITPQRARMASRAYSKKSPLSPAPPAVMSELNRVRIKLAESERKGRQLARKLEDTQKIADKAVQHREAAWSAESRAERLRNEVTALTREAEKARADEEIWEAWRGGLRKAFADILKEDSGDDEGDEMAPPEVSALLRHVRFLQEQVRTLDGSASSARTQLEVGKRRIASLEQQLKALNTSVERSFLDRTDFEKRADAAESDLRKIQAQEKIWRREADGLRSLLATYEKTQEERWKGAGKATTAATAAAGSAPPKAQDGGNGPTVKGLQLGLNSARDQIRVLEEEAATLRAQAKEVQGEKSDLKDEHERVLDKFGKLREALFNEREKAEKAEEKAHRAEMLVGKGHFNDETTRALHLKDNPLMTAVREKFQKEIDSLKRELDAKEEELATTATAGSTNGGETGGSSSGAKKRPSSRGKEGLSSLDAQKLHQRLKESFKEQIGLFREGVTLLTGYKVDMFTDSDRPRFKVRSIYSDREDDHLLFIWPKTKKGEDNFAVESLDLLTTKMAQLLAQSPSFEYMTKFKSMPAFMASVQLSLFEKTTFAG